MYFFFLEIYSGDYRLSFVQGSNSIGVEFCIQKDAVYLREFNATEKLKQGNSTGKWNKHLTEQEEDNFKKKPQKVWLMEASSQYVLISVYLIIYMYLHLSFRWE